MPIHTKSNRLDIKNFSLFLHFHILFYLLIERMPKPQNKCRKVARFSLACTLDTAASCTQIFYTALSTRASYILKKKHFPTPKIAIGQILSKQFVKETSGKVDETACCNQHVSLLRKSLCRVESACEERWVAWQVSRSSRTPTVGGLCRF